MQFTSILASSFIAFALSVVAIPATNTANGIVSLADMKSWVDKQDPANITLVDDPFGPKSLAAQTITVTYCTQISGTICTGSCTVVSGSGTCIEAGGTNCLFATGEVTFCDRGGCGGSCNEFNSCGKRLANNFCATPGTASIGIPAGA